jgi:hypothetical protein
MRIHHVSPLFLALTLAGCDAADNGSSTMRESIEDALDEANITLAEAVSTAVAEAGGVAIDAELDVENQTTVFDVEIYVDGGLTRVAIDVGDGTVVRVRASSSGNDDDNAANAAFATGVDWAALIAAAEAEVGGIAFELKADDGELEVEVLAPDGIFEIELAVDGTILKVDVSDDGDDDGLDDDDDDGSDDDDGGSDDDGDDDSDDDGNSGSN